VVLSLAGAVGGALVGQAGVMLFNRAIAIRTRRFGSTSGCIRRCCCS
jgi:hypothetical protein